MNIQLNRHTHEDLTSNQKSPKVSHVKLSMLYLIRILLACFDIIIVDIILNIPYSLF